MALTLNLFRKFFPDRKLPTPDPDRPGRYTFRENDGQDLTAIPAAYAAIGLLSSTLTQLPRTVARLDDPLEDHWTAEADHPVSTLLRHPSRLVDPWLFWEWMFRQLFAKGNAYAWIRRDNQFRPVELVPAECTRCVWATGGRGPVTVYDLELWGGPESEADRLRNQGSLLPGMRQVQGVRAGDVVVLHGPGFNGLASPSPVQYAARRSLQAMDQAGLQQQRLLASGGLQTVLKTDPVLDRLTSEQLEDSRRLVRETFDSARETGSVPVLPPGYDVVSAGGMMSAVDIQIIELLRLGVEDVARVWNIPPRMLYHYYRGFRVTMFEQQAQDFERWTVRGYVQRVEEQFTAKLMSRQDVSENRVVRMPTDRIRAGSWSERVNAVDQAVAKAGVMTINEGRRLLRLPPVEDGDRLLQPKGAPAQDLASQGAGDDEGMS